jgi:hypothetical protein
MAAPPNRPGLSHGADGWDRELSPPSGLRVGPAPGKGRGVFAARAFARGEVVEAAPVLVLPPHEQEAIDETVLAAYVFAWGDTLAIALGFGSLYNHSWSPNLEYLKRFAEGIIEFVAIRDIAPGEELTTNYSASNPHRAGLWADLG